MRNTTIGTILALVAIEDLELRSVDISKRIDVMLSKLSSNLKVTWYKKDK
jgi:hypothetical protein